MKFLTFPLLFMFLASISILVGCKQQTPKIGILMHDYDNDRWVKDKNYLVEFLTKQGAEVLVETADNDQNKQIEQAQNMIKNGIKVLIVVPVNQDESAKIVDLAHESNVIVIAYHRMINGCQLDYFVASNAAQIGELQASSLISVKPQSKYALIGVCKIDNNSQCLFLGQMNVLQPLMERGDVKLVYSEYGEEWLKEDGYRQVKIILDDDSDDLTGIICGNHNLAMGAMMALKESGLDGKVIIAGQDAELPNLKEIMKGKQTSTILKPLKETATVATELAVLLAMEKSNTIKFDSESNGKINFG